MSEEAKDLVIVVAGVSREKSLLTKQAYVNQESQMNWKWILASMVWDSIGNERSEEAGTEL